MLQTRTRPNFERDLNAKKKFGTRFKSINIETIFRRVFQNPFSNLMAKWSANWTAGFLRRESMTARDSEDTFFTKSVNLNFKCRPKVSAASHVVSNSSPLSIFLSGRWTLWCCCEPLAVAPSTGYHKSDRGRWHTRCPGRDLCGASSETRPELNRIQSHRIENYGKKNENWM